MAEYLVNYNVIDTNGNVVSYRDEVCYSDLTAWHNHAEGGWLAYEVAVGEPTNKIAMITVCTERNLEYNDEVNTPKRCKHIGYEDYKEYIHQPYLAMLPRMAIFKGLLQIDLERQVAIISGDMDIHTTITALHYLRVSAERPASAVTAVCLAECGVHPALAAWAGMLCVPTDEYRNLPIHLDKEYTNGHDHGDVGYVTRANAARIIGATRYDTDAYPKIRDEGYGRSAKYLIDKPGDVSFTGSLDDIEPSQEVIKKCVSVINAHGVQFSKPNDFFKLVTLLLEWGKMK